MSVFKVAVVVVWLSNADGSIVAQASGIAVDVPACERLAAKKIADESGDPHLAGSTAHFSCLNRSTTNRARERNTAPGSVEL